MKKEMERQDRERRKLEERMMRERQRQEERFQREERRESERREKLLQKESLKVMIYHFTLAVNVLTCLSICFDFCKRRREEDNKKSFEVKKKQ